METVSYSLSEIRSPDVIQQRRIVIGAMAFVVLSSLLTIVFQLPALLSMIIATQIVLFCFSFYRPVFALAALFVQQLTASNWVFFIGDTMVSIRFAWTVMSLLLLIPILHRRGGIKLEAGAKRVIVPAVVLFAFTIIATAANTDVAYLMQYLRVVATALTILIFLPAVINDEQDLKILAITALITCAISAILAIAQHYHFRFLPTSTIFGGNIWGRRAMGLNESAVDLGFTLPMIMVPAIGMLFVGGVNRRYLWITVITILLMGLALYFTFTRSGIYSLGAGVIAMLFVLKSKFKKELFLLALILGAAFLIYTDMKENRYAKGFEEEDSAAGRLLLWEAGTRIALDHPFFGIGHNKFKEMARSYISSIESESRVIGIEEVLGVEQPHNDFIRVWVSFGTPALIAFIWLFISIFWNFFDSYRKLPGRFARGMAIGGFAALLTYGVNAATHNMMDTVCFLWMLGGLSIATYKLAIWKKRPAKVSA